MSDRNPYIPGERAKGAKEQTTIDQKESRRELSKQAAEEERRARRHEEPAEDENVAEHLREEEE